MKVMQHVDPTCFCGYNRFHPSILPNSQRSSSSAQLDIILCFTNTPTAFISAPLIFSAAGFQYCWFVTVSGASVMERQNQYLLNLSTSVQITSHMLMAGVNRLMMILQVTLWFIGSSITHFDFIWLVTPSGVGSACLSRVRSSAVLWYFTF